MCLPWEAYQRPCGKSLSFINDVKSSDEEPTIHDDLTEIYLCNYDSNVIISPTPIGLSWLGLFVVNNNM